jgi:hypothetical protein
MMEGDSSDSDSVHEAVVVADATMEAMLTEESLSPATSPTAVDAAMEAMLTDDDSDEASPPPAPPKAVDVVMTLLDEDSTEDSQPGLCSFLVYPMVLMGYSRSGWS